ncbi:type IV secretory system conjugative DNA transfer family protein [Mycoplasmopsis felis]|uniref:type IV secretory system conjugative DNA transfer family protein n=1 Tax=Mycoplasmopsis felis TaxID=33923 RepID=UPI003A4D5CF3
MRVIFFILKILAIFIVGYLFLILISAVVYVILKRNELSGEIFKDIVYLKALFFVAGNENPYIRFPIVSSYFIFLLTFSGWMFREKIKEILKTFSKQGEFKSKWLFNEKTNEKDYKQFREYIKKSFYNSPGWVLSFKVNKLTKKQRWLNIPHDKLDRNSLIIGGTGSGKTQRVLLPNILYNINLLDEYKPNLVIIDPKKELISFTGKRIEDNGYKIYVIDFEDTLNSLKWNPLSHIYDLMLKAKETNDEDYLSLANKKLINIIENLNWGGDDFWTASGKKIIEIILKSMLLFAYHTNTVSREDFNFTNVAKNINGSNFNSRNSPLLNTLNTYSEIHNRWKDVKTDLESILANSENTLGSMLQSALRPLDSFNKDDFIKNLTSNTENFNLREILSANEKFVIFIHYSDENTANHKLVSMLVDEIYQTAIEQAKSNKKNLGYEKLERKLLFFLEEFGNLPKIPNLENKLAINRSRNILFNLVVQDMNQLKKYNTNENREIDKIILSNLQFVYFLNTSDIETKNYIIKLLGKQEIQKTSYSTSGSSSSQNISYQKENLMEIDQLSKKSANDILILIEGLLPLYLKTSLAYKYFKNDNYVYKTIEELTDYKFFEINDELTDLVQKSLNPLLDDEKQNLINNDFEINAKLQNEMVNQIHNDNFDTIEEYLDLTLNNQNQIENEFIYKSLDKQNNVLEKAFIRINDEDKLIVLKEVIDELIRERKYLFLRSVFKDIKELNNSKELNVFNELISKYKNDSNFDGIIKHSINEILLKSKSLYFDNDTKILLRYSLIDELRNDNKYSLLHIIFKNIQILINDNELNNYEKLLKEYQENKNDLTKLNLDNQILKIKNIIEETEN